MEGLDKIIDALKDIRTLKKLEVSDEVLFSEACSILRGQYASQNKFNYSKPKEPKNDSSETTTGREHLPPTKSQVKILEEHKYTIPKTRGEATKLIKEYFEKTKKKNI